MEKEEYVKEFIKVINAQEEDKIYRFFTRNSSIYLINKDKELDLGELVTYLKDNYFGKEIIIVRELKSKVCNKLECKVNDKDVSFYFEIKDRRIFRLEILD